MLPTIKLLRSSTPKVDGIFGSRWRHIRWAGPAVAGLLLQSSQLLAPDAANARPYRTTHRYRQVRRSPNWGCWVDIFAGPDYARPSRRIMGPIDLANLQLSDKNWGNAITSIKTGPHAWVKVFKDTSYRGDYLTLRPRTAIRSLRPLKFKDAIDSISVRNHPF